MMDEGTKLVIDNINKRLDKVENKADNLQYETTTIKVEIAEIKSENKNQTILLNQINQRFAEYDKEKHSKIEKDLELRINEESDTKRVIKHKVLDFIIGGVCTGGSALIIWVITSLMK